MKPKKAAKGDSSAITTGTGTLSGRTTRTSAVDPRRRRRAKRRASAGRLWLLASHALGRMGRALRDVVTPAGWVTVGAVFVGWVVGWWWAWSEFLVAGTVATILLLIAAPFLFSRKAYRVKLGLERDRVTVGQELPAGIEVANTRRRPVLPTTLEVPIGAGLIEVSIPLLGPSGTYGTQIDISTAKRGIVDVGPARVTIGDPVGLLQREKIWHEVHRVYIRPKTVALTSTSTGFVRDLEGIPSSKLVNDDLAFHAIREYVPGDSQRQIHWKSTAKTGQLMVRQFEETRRSEMLVVLDLAEDGYADEDEFEMAVSAAASIGLRGIQDGRDLKVVAGKHLPPFAPIDTRGINELRSVTPGALLDDMCSVSTAERVNSLPDVVGQATENNDSMSIAVLVFGSRVTPSLMRQAALSLPLGVPVMGILCDAAAPPSFRRLGDLRIISIGILDDLRHLMARGAER